MKGILMKTWEVCALLAARKTVKRLVVKPPALYAIQEDESGKCVGSYYEDENSAYIYPTVDDCRYQFNDILYVLETWTIWNGDYEYKADVDDGYGPFCSSCTLDICAGNCNSVLKWRPSIHMPREAARIFLRVTDVRVERLQDITDVQALAEGVPEDCDTPKKRFSNSWDSTIKSVDRGLYGWDANPFVWVIEFEQCERPEGG